jgi:hypothetical protein
VTCSLPCDAVRNADEGLNVNPAAVLRTSCTERQRPLRQAGDVLVVTRLERLARSTRDVLARRR